MNKATDSEIVAIIGASEKPGRYAKKAQELLVEKGHTVVPINPVKESVVGIQAYKSLSDVPETIKIDTVTLYVRPELLERHIKSIVDRKVKRVIFNPGTESKIHQAELDEAGIPFEEACTLILLNTGQF